MKYRETVSGTFIDRPNRFIAEVSLDGRPVRCHVKNTGRCREILIPGARVVLSVSSDPARKTSFDLVAVYKGDTLINIDSQAPNAVVKESFERIVGRCDSVTPEHTVGESRFDFCARSGDRDIVLEVKGVTLEDRGLAMFPDAPTERGLKHVRELTRLAGEGRECWLVFVVQLRPVRSVIPNHSTDPEFGRACAAAVEAGVRIVAYDCSVTEDSMVLGERVPFGLHQTRAVLFLLSGSFSRISAIYAEYVFSASSWSRIICIRM